MLGVLIILLYWTCPKLWSILIFECFLLNSESVPVLAFVKYTLFYVMLCILYLKSIHKIVHNKKLINIDWLMLHSLQETKCDGLLLLLLLQPTQTKFKQQQPQQQQKPTQFRYENSTKASRLHFSDSKYIYML